MMSALTGCIRVDRLRPIMEPLVPGTKLFGRRNCILQITAISTIVLRSALGR
jgi:hypothetical protein